MMSKLTKGLPTGPDKVNGGDGLPDWMQFTISLLMFGTFSWIIWLLFHPTLDLEDNFRDLLNIIVGTFLASFGKVVDFWFKHDKKTDNS
tara:strand:- start:284 stop:550 length:267 start_codon:yes stop_codon:yes gene_type:complete